MDSVDNKIEGYIKSAKTGSILFVEDLLGFGSNGAVHTALHRIVKKKNDTTGLGDLSQTLF